jgi:hypothetical protein
MQRLAPIQLAVDATPVFLALEVAEDEEGLLDTAVLLQAPRQRVLARRGLEPGDQQRGGYQPSLIEPPTRSRSSQCLAMSRRLMVPVSSWSTGRRRRLWA